MARSTIGLGLSVGRSPDGPWLGGAFNGSSTHPPAPFATGVYIDPRTGQPLPPLEPPINPDPIVLPDSANVLAGAGWTLNEITASNVAAADITVVWPEGADATQVARVTLTDTDGTSVSDGADKTIVPSGSTSHPLDTSSLLDGPLSMMVTVTSPFGSETFSGPTVTRAVAAVTLAIPESLAVAAGPGNAANVINETNESAVDVELVWPGVVPGGTSATVSLDDGMGNKVESAAQAGVASGTVSYTLDGRSLAEGVVSVAASVANGMTTEPFVGTDALKILSGSVPTISDVYADFTFADGSTWRADQLNNRHPSMKLSVKWHFYSDSHIGLEIHNDGMFHMGKFQNTWDDSVRITSLRVPLISGWEVYDETELDVTTAAGEWNLIHSGQVHPLSSYVPDVTSTNVFLLDGGMTYLWDFNAVGVNPYPAPTNGPLLDSLRAYLGLPATTGELHAGIAEAINSFNVDPALNDRNWLYQISNRFWQNNALGPWRWGTTQWGDGYSNHHYDSERAALTCYVMTGNVYAWRWAVALAKHKICLGTVRTDPTNILQHPGNTVFNRNGYQHYEKTDLSQLSLSGQPGGILGSYATESAQNSHQWDEGLCLVLGLMQNPTLLAMHNLRFTRMIRYATESGPFFPYGGREGTRKYGWFIWSMIAAHQLYGRTDALPAMRQATTNFLRNAGGDQRFWTDAGTNGGANGFFTPFMQGICHRAMYRLIELFPSEFSDVEPEVDARASWQAANTIESGTGRLPFQYKIQNPASSSWQGDANTVSYYMEFGDSLWRHLDAAGKANAKLPFTTTHASRAEPWDWRNTSFGQAGMEKTITALCNVPHEMHVETQSA